MISKARSNMKLKGDRVIYVVSLTSSFRPILYPPFTCSSPGVISEVSLLVAMPQRVHQRQYFRIQNSRTDSRSIRSRFFITVCTKRTTFSANPVSLHTWTSRGDTWRATAYGSADPTDHSRPHCDKRQQQTRADQTGLK